MQGANAAHRDDAALAARCAAREEDAWREFLSREGPRLRAVLSRVFARAGAPSPGREADEALGDLVSSLLEKDAALLRAYRPEAPLRSYLAVLARTTAFRILRKRHPGRSFDEAADLPAGLPEELPADPARLKAALARLPDKQRLLLQLVYWEGLPQAEAARLLHLAPGSVGWLLGQAREALRKILEAES